MRGREDLARLPAAAEEGAAPVRAVAAALFASDPVSFSENKIAEDALAAATERSVCKGQLNAREAAKTLREAEGMQARKAQTAEEAERALQAAEQAAAAAGQAAAAAAAAPAAHAAAEEAAAAAEQAATAAAAPAAQAAADSEEARAQVTVAAEALRDARVKHKLALKAAAAAAAAASSRDQLAAASEKREGAAVGAAALRGLVSALPPHKIVVDAGIVSSSQCTLYELKRRAGTEEAEVAKRRLERALLLVRWARHAVLADAERERSCWCGGRGTRCSPTHSGPVCGSSAAWQCSRERPRPPRWSFATGTASLKWCLFEVVPLEICAVVQVTTARIQSWTWPL